MTRGTFTNDQIAHYHQEGFLVEKSLFDAEEIALLRRAAKEDRALDEHAFGRQDGEGGRVRLALWNHPGEGIYGAIARCRRVVDSAEQLLNDEAYHYHSKMIMKEAQTGGAWAWHQDYGYWYENGVLFPDLCSVFIAVDPCTRENGCMQVLGRSHRLGRVTHMKVGDQTGADPERVAAAVERLPLVYVEMAPGDALFFHANLLHRSDQNRSPHDRWALICCYNAKHNDPYKDSHHPRYTPLKKLDDDQVKIAGRSRFAGENDDTAWHDGVENMTSDRLTQQRV